MLKTNPNNFGEDPIDDGPLAQDGMRHSIVQKRLPLRLQKTQQSCLSGK